MNSACVPAGETVLIRNTTNQVIKDLYYRFGMCNDCKISNINKNAKDKFFIITSTIERDQDLFMFFESDPTRLFVFENAVKCMSKEVPYSYFFIKVIEVEGKLELCEDEDGSKLFFEDSN